MNASFIDLSCEFFSPHLVPEQSALLMHLFELSVSDNSIKVLLAILFSDAQNLKRISNNCFLDFVVQWTVSHERGCLVNFKQPGLCVSVYQDVEAKNFKAHIEGTIIWLACSVAV